MFKNYEIFIYFLHRFYNFEIIRTYIFNFSFYFYFSCSLATALHSIFGRKKIKKSDSFDKIKLKFQNILYQNLLLFEFRKIFLSKLIMIYLD